MVISTATGSGKTVLFELCMLRLLSRFLTTDFKVNHAKGTLKTIYVAPSKALVQEKLRDWSQKFGALGINCLELTGDNDFYNVRDVQDADIILTTPEMKNGGLSFFSNIALLLIGEVCWLNDPHGAALEAVVSRIKMLLRNADLKPSPLASVHLLAVSATIPNIEDVDYAPAKNDFLFEQGLALIPLDIRKSGCITLKLTIEGALSLKDRDLVEDLFLKCDVQILCTTNTIAHVINLPAHSVVIKSIRNYNKEKGLYLEYDRSTLLQMCGRAGRPQFDNEGMVVIMTRKEMVFQYLLLDHSMDAS